MKALNAVFVWKPLSLGVLLKYCLNVFITSIQVALNLGYCRTICVLIVDVRFKFHLSYYKEMFNYSLFVSGTG